MKYEDVLLLEYIRYLSKKAYEQAPDFDGYVRLDPAKCQKNNGLTQDQQGRAIRSLKRCGAASYRVEGETVYLKAAELAPPTPKQEYHGHLEEMILAQKILSKHGLIYRHGWRLPDYFAYDQNEYPDDWEPYYKKFGRKLPRTE